MARPRHAMRVHPLRSKGVVSPGRTIAVHTASDRHAMFVREADGPITGDTARFVPHVLG